MRILLVEDDADTVKFLVKALNAAGHVADQALDGITGLEMAIAGEFDVLIVDRMLPKLDGLKLISSLRAQGDQTPVLILSALSKVDDRVEGLRAGSDDYLTKPFAFSELLARVEGMARRSNPPVHEARQLQAQDLIVDRLSHKVSRGDTSISLQPREYRLLEYLLQHKGQVVTRTMLLEHVWDYHFDPGTNVVDVHMSRLRSKIDKGFETPLLKTIRGAGYMIDDGA